MTFSTVFEEQNSECYKYRAKQKPPETRWEHKRKNNDYSGKDHEKAEKSASGMMFPHIEHRPAYFMILHKYAGRSCLDYSIFAPTV